MVGNLKIHRTQERDRPYRKYRSPTTNTTNEGAYMVVYVNCLRTIQGFASSSISRER